MCLAVCLGCRSDAGQQDAIALARSKGADIRINVKGDAQRVDLRRCSIDDELRSALKQLPVVETLLVCRAFDDSDTDVLEYMPSLRNLDLSHSRISETTLHQLMHLRQLEFLSLNGLSLSDADMKIVSQLRQLTSLSLVDAKVSAESLEQFRMLNPNCLIAR